MDTLRNNVVRVRTDLGLTDNIQVNCGVRQGDPLSTTLFALVIDPLIRRLALIDKLEHTEGPQAFADDIDIMSQKRRKRGG